MIDTWVETREAEQRAQVAMAWHVAALQRSKKLPTLRSLLFPRKARNLAADEVARIREELAAKQTPAERARLIEMARGGGRG